MSCRERQRAYSGGVVNDAPHLVDFFCRGVFSAFACFGGGPGSLSFPVMVLRFLGARAGEDEGASTTFQGLWT
jgi:hypothetical protein